MKNKLKIIAGIVIAIIFLVIYGVFIREDNNSEINKPIKPSTDETISKNYNNVLSEIKIIKDIKKCDKIEQKNLSDMCKYTIKDRFAPERSFTKLDECNNIYTGSTDSRKQALDICRYNVALANIRSKEDISKCDKIGNKTFANMCKDIIMNRYN
ncbi:MAG: hypothetical protein PHG82_04030 [Candidatus Gracilibacteria bacterium]|nr:hypothetical protein [Candidatus Gracilibacteria bacterium]